MTTDKTEAPTTPAKPRRNAWLIAGGAVTAVVLLAAVASAGALIWIASAPRETDSRADAYGSVASVDMSVAAGSVELTGADGPELSVETDMSWKGSEPEIEEELTADGVFEVRARCGEDYLFWMIVSQCEVDYSAAVPSGAPVAVETTTAGIDIDGLEGALDVETTTGEVYARNLRTSGAPVAMETTTAGIDIDGLEGALDVGTTTGEIDARGLRTSGASVETTTGDVTVAFEELRGDVDITTTTGDVTVLVPDDGTVYEVRYDSTTGEEDIGIATDPSETDGRVIDVSTTTGDLEVRYTS